MQKNVIPLILSLCLWGCRVYLPPAIGDENTVVILCSSEDRPLLEPLLSKVFDRTMATPQPEAYFELRWEDILDFETYKKYKNLVIASLSTPPDSTADMLVRHILGEDRVRQARKGENPIFVTSDLFAREQIFMGITASDAVHAGEEIKRLADWIFLRFEEQFSARQYEAMYAYKPNKKLMRRMEESYHWRFLIQQDYMIVKEKPDENFIWLGRGYPYRWLGVHWLDEDEVETINPGFAWRHQEYIADQLFESIYIDTFARSSDISAENGHAIYILRGVWGHREQVSGGPFFSYIFHDEEQHRIYFVTGIVFNPGGPKAVLLRQQEVMVRTFHTFEKPPVDKDIPVRPNMAYGGSR